MGKKVKKIKVNPTVVGHFRGKNVELIQAILDLPMIFPFLHQ